MNYRHSFHAGNFADVHKHVVLLAVLERLRRKPTPLFHLDTHAGSGAYSLKSAEAVRGNEWRSGIGRLSARTAASADINRYLAAVRAMNQASAGSDLYPGSPVLIAAQLREGDRAVMVEQQPQDARELQSQMQGRRGVSIVCGDGYAALKSHLPPKENRGLVLIDPAYEAVNEFQILERALLTGLQRWPNGVFIGWYPIKPGAEVQRLHAALNHSATPKLLSLELNVRPNDSPAGLNGSGLIVANPPWQLDIEMAATLPELQQLLAPDAGGGTRVRWLGQAR